MIDRVRGWVRGHSKLRRAIVEGAVVVAIGVLAAWYGRFAFLNAAVPPDYHYLSPAVSVAVGKGFHNPLPAPGTPMEAFVLGQAPAVSWADAASLNVGPVDAFHESTRYLINVVGYWWRFAGISRAAIADVAAAFHVMAVAGTYALLRLFLPWPFAAAGALWMCVSTLQLALVPHVRDYSKGAFIICALPLAAALALRPLPRRALYAVAAATGALVGFGIGFKMDVAIMGPLAVAGIVFFRGRRPWTDLLEKAKVAGVLVAAFLVAAGPLLYRMSSGGSNAAHVVLLGYADGFDTSLGIDRSVYTFLPFYSDTYVAMMVQAHSAQREWLGFPSPEYDVAGQRVLLDLARHFPADVFARALAAADTVMNLCFVNRDPTFLTRPLPAQDAQIAVYAWLHRFDGWGAVMAPLLVIVASLGSLRRGAWAALALLVLAGYPSLQFESRHYFHTQIVPVTSIVVLVWAVLATARSAVTGRLPFRDPGAPTRVAANVFAAVTVMAVLFIMPLVALRAYQPAHLERMLTRYLDTRTQLQTTVAPDGPHASLVQWGQQEAIPLTSGALQTAHYVAEFVDDGSMQPIDVAVRYDALSLEHDFSRVLSLRPTAGSNRVGFSVLSVTGQSAFAGIELGAGALRRLSGVYRVESGGPAGLPLDLRLPADWQDRLLFQRLRIEAANSRAMPGRSVMCAQNPGCRGMLGYLDRFSAMPPGLPRDSVGTIHAPIATVTADGVSIDGMVENESSYLIQLNEWTTRDRGAFVVEGYLQEGGVTIGLLKERAWYKPMTVRARGEFVVVVPVDGPGSYIPLITNAMSPGQRYNRVTITKAGFLGPD